MKKSPLQLVKERFGGKDKLVEAVQQLTIDELWLDTVNDAKGLVRVSNAKLLRLHTILSSVKDQFGSRAQLIGSILELEKRQKDEGYKARLERYSTPRLLDLHGAATKRSKQAAVQARSADKPAARRRRRPLTKKAKAKAQAAA